MCSVYLKDSEKVVSISSEHLEPVTPTKSNKVGTPPACPRAPLPSWAPPYLPRVPCGPSRSPQVLHQPLWDPPSPSGMPPSSSGTLPHPSSPPFRPPAPALIPPPAPPPQVKVILGEDREATGILLSIDGEDGIVRMDLEEQLKILNLRFLGKLLEA